MHGNKRISYTRKCDKVTSDKVVRAERLLPQGKESRQMRYYFNDTIITRKELETYVEQYIIKNNAYDLKWLLPHRPLKANIRARAYKIARELNLNVTPIH